jgi:hypothetical protein
MEEGWGQIRMYLMKISCDGLIRLNWFTVVSEDDVGLVRSVIRESVTQSERSVRKNVLTVMLFTVQSSRINRALVLLVG